MIKHVGPKPMVSAHGVSFDDTKADRYTFLSPAIKLIEVLSSDVSDDGSYDMKGLKSVQYSDGQLLEKIKENCKDLDAILESARKKTETLIGSLEDTVEKSSSISSDGKRAWLGNIRIMKDYYLQYIINETAYRCLLNILADIFVKNHVKSIVFPLYHNYGLALSHLIHILRDHKPPVDASLDVIEHNGEKYGRFSR
jgi:hypothetical protein